MSFDFGDEEFDRGKAIRQTTKRASAIKRDYSLLDALDEIDVPDPAATSASVARSAPLPNRSVGQVIGDTAIEAGNQVVGTVGAVGNFISPGNRVSQAADDLVRRGEANQSPQTQATKKQFREDLEAADGFREEAGVAGRYLASNPLLTGAMVLGNVIGPLGAVKGAGAIGGAIGRGMARRGGATADDVAAAGARGQAIGGTAGGVALGAAGAGGDAAGQAYELVTDPQRREVVLSSPQARALRQATPLATDDEIVESLAVDAARKASVAPGILGGAFGLFGVERLLGGAARGATRGGQALRTGLIEGGEEGVEETVTGISGRYFPSEIDPSIDPMKGAGADAVMGAVVGAGMGATAGALSRPQQAPADPNAEPTTEPTVEPTPEPTQPTSVDRDQRLADRLQSAPAVDLGGNRVDEQGQLATDEATDGAQGEQLINEPGVPGSPGDPPVEPTDRQPGVANNAAQLDPAPQVQQTDIQRDAEEDVAPTQPLPDPSTYDGVQNIGQDEQTKRLEEIRLGIRQKLGLPEDTDLNIRTATQETASDPVRWELSNRVANTLKKLFDIDVVLADFGTARGPGGETVLTSTDNKPVGLAPLGLYAQGRRTVLIDAASPKLLDTAIHEPIHFIEENYPDLYKSLADTVRQYSTKSDKLKAGMDVGLAPGRELDSEFVAMSLAEAGENSPLWTELFRRAGEVGQAQTFKDKVVEVLDAFMKAIQGDFRYIKEYNQLRAYRRAVNDAFTKAQIRTAQERLAKGPQRPQNGLQGAAAAQTTPSTTQPVEAPVGDATPVDNTEEQPTDPEPLYEYIKERVLDGRTRPSTEGIQKAHRIGYGKALTTIRRLEQEGVVSPAGERGARTVNKDNRDKRSPEPIPEPTYDEEVNEEPGLKFSRQGNPSSPLKSYVSQEDADGRVRRRDARKPGIGAPDNERVEFTVPVKVGDKTVQAKLAVGRITTEDWRQRALSVMSLAELADARRWYESLNNALTPVYGPDATKYALAWLLSQKRASPSKGFTDVLRAADIASGKQRVQIAGLNEQALIDTMQGRVPERDIGPKLLDFVDSELGKTTRTVVRDDARGRMPAAIDVWAYRDIGFVDERLKEFVRETVGPEAAEALKIDSQTEAAYEYGIDFYNDIADQLSAEGFDGGNWKASEVQAIGWVAMQKVMGEQAEFVRDIIGKNTRRVSIGLAPGGGTRMADVLAGKEIDPKTAQSVIRRLAKAAGVKVLKNDVGAGAYLTYIEGAIQIEALASPEGVADFMDMVGYAFQQTEIIATRPMKSGKNSAIDILSPQLKTIGDATNFFQAFLASQPKDKGGDPIAPGFQQVEVGGVPGIRLLNFGGKWGTRVMPQLVQAINDAGAAVGVQFQQGDVKHFFVTLTSTKNDWTKDQDGKAYLNSLSGRGRVREARELERRFPPSRLDLDGDGSIVWRRERRVPDGLRPERDAGQGDGQSQEVQLSRARQYEGQVAGTAPVFSDRAIQPAAAEFVGYHYSAVPRQLLSGTSYGSATSANRGKEYERVTQAKDRRLRDRVYFYTAPMAEIPRSEPVVTGAQIHKVVLKNIYDPRNDDPRISNEGGNARESSIIDAGYDGYVSHEAGMIVALNTKPIPVQHIGNRQGLREQIQPNPVLSGAMKIEYPNRSVLTRDGMLTRRPENNEVLNRQQRAAVEQAAPSFGMEYGEYKVRPEEKDAANQAAANAGASFQFSRQTDTPAFKRWFGDSKVVNALGKPRVVFHGTASDFDVFDLSRAGENYGIPEERAFFFTGRRETAESAANDATKLPNYMRSYQNQGFGGGMGYGDAADYYDYDDDTPYDSSADWNGGQNIMPVYLSIQNPLVLKADRGEGVGQWLETRGETIAQLIERAKSEGHDGIIVNSSYRNYEARNRIQRSDRLTDEQKRKLLDGLAREDARKQQTDAYFIAFRPEQIKSAIGNNGNFDPADPRIQFSRQVAANPNFKRWFGDSKIVTEDGTPKVMYHGTARDITAFRPKQAGAIFVTEDPGFAERFSDASASYIANETLAGMDAEQRAALAGPIAKRIRAEYKSRKRARDELLGNVDRWVSTGVAEGEMKDFLVLTATEAGLLGSGQNILPLYVKAENPFDYENEAHLDALRAELNKQTDRWGMPLGRQTIGYIKTGNWEQIERADVQDAMKALGHDGFYVSEGGEKNLAVYDPNQLKSAIGNNGEYDPSVPDINLSRPVRYQGNRFTIAERTLAERASNQMLNEMSRVRDVQQQIASQGGAFDRTLDVDNENRRQIRLAGNKIERFRQEKVDPLMKRVAKLGVELGDIDLLMYARFAPQRNKYIAGINSRFADGGSGMKDAEAKQAIAALQAKHGAKYAQLLQLAKEFQALTNDTRSVLRQSGLVDPQVLQAWQTGNPDYVPLKGFDKVDDDAKETSNADPRWDFSKRALGRHSKAGQIVQNILKDHERAVSMAAVNETRKTLLDFVQQNADDKLWEVDRVVMTQQFRKTLPQSPLGYAQGIVQHIAKINESKQNTVAVRVGGNLAYITVKDPGMLDDLNRLSVVGLPGDVQRFLNGFAKINKALGFLYTALSPAFVLTNAARDLTYGTIRTARNYGAAAGIRAPLRAIAAVPSIYKALYTRNWDSTKGTKYERYFNEFREVGGAMGIVSQLSVDHQTERLGRSIARYQGAIKDDPKTWHRPALSVAATMVDFIVGVNTGIEQAIRVASYAEARESGKSQQEAADIAANVTVDFARRGKFAPLISSLYLFYNPAVQGAANTVDLITGGKGWKGAAVGTAGVVAPLMALGFYVAAMSSMAVGDDDEPYWDSPANEATKLKNLIFFNPDGSQVRVPLPYGIGLFVNLGYAMHDIAQGKPASQAASFMLKALATHFSPLGDPENPISFVSPTAIDPVMVLFSEKREDGAPLMPTDYTGNTPNSERYFAKTRGTLVQEFTEWLNRVTDGNESRAGAISVSPESINYLINFATGGLGTFVRDLVQTLDLTISDEFGTAQEKNLIPILKSVYRTADNRTYAATFYENMKQIEAAAKEAREQADSDDPATQERLWKNSGIASMERSLRATKRQLAALRKEDIAIVDSDMTRAQKEAARKIIDEQRKDLFVEMNRAYKLYSED